MAEEHHKDKVMFVLFLLNFVRHDAELDRTSIWAEQIFLQCLK